MNWTSMLFPATNIFKISTNIFLIKRNGNGIVTFQEFVMFYEKGKFKEYL